MWGLAVLDGRSGGTVVTQRKGANVTAAQVDQWTMSASCRGMEDKLFCEAKDQRQARKVCRHCPVQIDCLIEALDNRIEWGVWGGMTERERRTLLRNRSDVVSWRSVLTTPRGVHGRA